MADLQRTDTGHVFVTIAANSPNLEQFAILEERDKAVRVRNTDNGRACWLPKAGLAPRRPNVPTYEGEYILRPWLRDRLDAAQERALNILE